MTKLLLVIALALGACGGARGTLAFDTLRYPVSSSPFVYAPDGQPVTLGALQQVGFLNESVRLWGIFYSWVPLSGTKDISEMINARIAAAHGEGIINLALAVSNCGINYIPFINWLPIYPGCTYVRVTGVIVRLNAAPPPPPPGPPSDAPPPPGEPPPNAFVPAGAPISTRVAELAR